MEPETPVTAPATPATAQADAASGDPSKNRLATISLVLGLLGLVLWIVPLLGYPATIVGLVLGIKGLASQKRKLAIAGIALASLGLLATLVNSVWGAYNAVTETETSSSTVPAVATPSAPLSGDLEAAAFQGDGYSMQVPRGWTSEGAALGASAIFRTDRANINVIKEAAPDLTLEAYVANSKAALAALDDYRLVEERRIDADTYLIASTFTQGNEVRTLQHLHLKDGQAYIVTGTTLASEWDAYAAPIEASLSTFAFK